MLTGTRFELVFFCFFSFLGFINWKILGVTFWKSALETGAGFPYPGRCEGLHRCDASVQWPGDKDRMGEWFRCRLRIWRHALSSQTYLQLFTLETHSLESTDAKHLLFWPSWPHALKLPLSQWQFWFLLPCYGMALTDVLLWNGYPRTDLLIISEDVFFWEWPNKGLVFVHFVKLHLIGLFQRA